MTGKQPDERLMALAQDARLLNVSEGVLFPLLEGMRENAIVLLCSKYRGGDTNLVAETARIAVLDDILNLLKTKQKVGNKAANDLTED